MNVSVLIATYGADSWRDLAWSRAYPSAAATDPFELIVRHESEGTLASVRNALADEATGEWLCFLDADDELDPGYLAAMAEAWYQGDWRDAMVEYPPVLLVPRIAYVNRGRRQPPKFWPKTDLRQGNWMPIGTLISRLLFSATGGFRERALYEDWELFLRAADLGAVAVEVPDAVYVAHVSADSRNRVGTRETRLRAMWEIGRELHPEIYDDGWLERHARRGRRARA